MPCSAAASLSLVERRLVVYLVAQVMGQQPPQVLAQQVSKSVSDDAAPCRQVPKALRAHQEQDGEEQPGREEHLPAQSNRKAAGTVSSA